MEKKRVRTNGKLFLTQETYIEMVIKRFSLHESEPVSLFLSARVKLSTDHSPKTEDELNRMANVPCTNAIGFVMHVMVSSRPNIAFVVSVLCRFMSNLGELHQEAMKHLIRYLRDTQKARVERIRTFHLSLSWLCNFWSSVE